MHMNCASSSKDKPIAYLMNTNVQIVWYVDINEVQVISQTIKNTHVQQYK